MKKLGFSDLRVVNVANDTKNHVFYNFFRRIIKYTNPQSWTPNVWGRSDSLPVTEKRKVVGTEL